MLRADDINQRLSANVMGWLTKWLPNGKLEGDEYTALNPARADRKRGSFKININSNLWSDFADGASGNDLISLYAYLFCGQDNGKAIKELRPLFDSAEPNPPAKRKVDKKPIAMHPIPADKDLMTLASNANYPVRRNSNESDNDYFKRFNAAQEEWQAAYFWDYKNADGLSVCIIIRFENEDGDKNTIPYLYNSHTQKLFSKAMPAPRLLWGLPDIINKEGSIIIVEGEKCALALQEAMPDYIVTTWAGGSKAVSKTEWSHIKDRRVIIWGDYDKAGLIAAEEVAEILKDTNEVFFVMPPDSPSGWDAADALNEWSLEEVRSLINKAEKYYTIDRGKPPATQADGKVLTLQTNSQGNAKASQYNLKMILQVMVDDGIISPLAYDEAEGRVISTDPTRPYEVSVSNGIEKAIVTMIRNKISEDYSLEFKAGDINDQIIVLARQNTINRINQFFESLPEWDGVSRAVHLFTKYLPCKPIQWVDKDNLTAAENATRHNIAKHFRELVAQVFLSGAISRGLSPGCKFDIMVILEGLQRIGKSTFFKRLFGEDLFSDAPILTYDHKDRVMHIRNYLCVEIAEMQGFSKRDSDQLKAFISTQVDKARMPYDKDETKMPRRCVMIGTTNKTAYLSDPTGNLRYVPLRVDSDGVLDMTPIEQDRGQILAEAKTWYDNAYNDGKAYLETGGIKMFLSPVENEVLAESNMLSTIINPQQQAVREYLDRIVSGRNLREGESIDYQDLMNDELLETKIIFKALYVHSNHMHTGHSDTVGGVASRMGLERIVKGGIVYYGVGDTLDKKAVLF